MSTFAFLPKKIQKKIGARIRGREHLGLEGGSAGDSAKKKKYLFI
jgi:hypothetical protein